MKNLIQYMSVLVVLVSLAHAGELNQSKGVVLDGYDLVAYFTQSQAVQGDVKFKLKHDGQIYYFSSEKNRQAFQNNPEKYQPEFDGYCAFAVANKGAKVPVDPTTFKFQDGKLLLFFNGDYNGTQFNTMVPWEKDPNTMMTKAVQQWDSIQKK